MEWLLQRFYRRSGGTTKSACCENCACVIRNKTLVKCKDYMYMLRLLSFAVLIAPALLCANDSINPAQSKLAQASSQEAETKPESQLKQDGAPTIAKENWVN